MESYLITSKDLAYYFLLNEEIVVLLSYIKRSKNLDSQIIDFLRGHKNLRDQEFQLLVDDQLLIDAIQYRFRRIAEILKRVSNGFIEKFIPFKPIHWALCMPQDYDLEFVFDIENELKDEILALEEFMSIDQEIDNYLNSDDFLNHKKNIDQFLHWIRNDGQLFFESWIEDIKTKYGMDKEVGEVTRKTVIDAWNRHDERVLDTSFKILKRPEMVNKDFTLRDFVIALNYIAVEFDINAFNKLKEDVGKKQLKALKDKENVLPWCTDYPYSIKECKLNSV